MTHALSVWQPWASLIVEGCKPYEFRNWPAPKAYIGQRIVIHAAKRIARADELAKIHADPLATCFGAPADRFGRMLDIIDREWNSRGTLPVGAGVGTAVLGAPIRAIDLPDLDEARRAGADPDKWAWPMLDPQIFAEPVPARGLQGFWRWPSAADFAA